MTYVVRFAILFIALFGSTAFWLAYFRVNHVRLEKQRDILKQCITVGSILSFSLLLLSAILAPAWPQAAKTCFLTFLIGSFNTSVWFTRFVLVLYRILLLAKMKKIGEEILEVVENLNKGSKT